MDVRDSAETNTRGKARMFLPNEKINDPPRESLVIGSRTHRNCEIALVNGRRKCTKRKPFLQPR
jgi:hypothetical protein